MRNLTVKINWRYQFLFIVFVALGLYYPAIFAGENSVDDFQMLQNLADQKLDIYGIFTPSGGFYYRPLLMLTFYLDQYLWDGTQSFMHLENILLHAANALLVYLLVKKSMRYFSEELASAPLLASLLFAIHPITTESVNWISGRTDLLGTFFVLLSTLVLLVAGERRSVPLTLAGAATFACAVTSKEVMVFYFPVACLAVWHAAGGGRGAARLLAAFAGPFILLALAYLLLRITTVPVSAHGVDDLLEKWRYDLYNTLRVTFKAFGFYVKKMFIPVPLNFAIRQVSDWYTLLGLGVALLSGWLLYARYRFFRPFAVAFWMVAPAILVALTNVAWTPLAERYIYLSSAFVCIGSAPLLVMAGRCFGAKVGVLLLGLLLISAATVTAQRNLVWQDNYLLYQDTLRKNPDFAAAHNEVGIALIETGRFDEAEVVLQKAIASGMGEKNPLIYINLSQVYLQRKDLSLARQTLKSSFTEPRNANLEVLKMLAKVSESALIHGEHFGFESNTQVVEEMVVIYQGIYSRNGDTSQLYRAGQLLLALKRNDEAGRIFAEVAARAPKDAFYYEAAKKLAKKFGAQSG